MLNQPTETNPDTSDDTAFAAASIAAPPAALNATADTALDTDTDAMTGVAAGVAGQVEDVEARFARHLRRLNEIGAALSAERDLACLLDKILSGARELTRADAGTLFLVNTGDTQHKDDDSLLFCTAQNDSVQLPPRIRAFGVSRHSLAGYVALSGETLCLDDVYQLPANAPYSFNPSFDQQHGYHTASVLVVPMRNHSGEVIGVLQLINRKRHRDAVLTDAAVVAREVVPFGQSSTDLATSLASQAAVAIENNRLLQQLQDLLDSFVNAAADAIEDRDPSTAGHSKRVTILTVGMANAASEAHDGRFAKVYFTPQQIKELQYSGWLHDWGKIGVPEGVLTKSHKLEPMHFQTVKDRLALLKQTRQTECVQRKLALLLARDDGSQNSAAVPGHAPDTVAELKRLDEELQREMNELDELCEALGRSNDPAVTWLPDDEYARQQEALDRLCSISFAYESDELQPLLKEIEKAALSIRKGSLTPDEYKQIQQHARLSFEFLNQIRWTPEFANIPDIAHCHHEKLDGSGYPRGVLAPEISLQSRMMAVADIYDALTASDRPYKKAMPVEKALSILRMEVKDGHLDGDVVELFIERQIYLLTQGWHTSNL